MIKIVFMFILPKAVSPWRSTLKRSRRDGEGGKRIEVSQPLKRIALDFSPVLNAEAPAGLKPLKAALADSPAVNRRAGMGT